MAHILIVDPEPRIADVLRKVLVSSGHQVETAENYAGAKKVLEAHPVEIIVADTDGNLDLLEEAKKEDATRFVIMTSLLPDKSTVLQALRGGAFRFLTKPISVRHLQATIKEATEEMAQLVEV